jgi:hypothetical protein
MDREERIEQLQREADEGRERIRQRQEERERDPAKMHDWLKLSHDNSKRHSVTASHEIIHKEMPIERQLPAEFSAAQNAEGWNHWIKAHLANERAELIDVLTRTIGEFASQYVHEKLQPLRTEIADLRRTLVERDERARALAEVKREVAGERVEREALQLSAALAARDAKIAALEDRMQILLRFLSLSGIDPPKGL